MKKQLCLLLSLLMLLSLACACKPGNEETDGTVTLEVSTTEAPTEAATEPETAQPVDPATLGEPTAFYQNEKGSTLTSYEGATEESYWGVRSYISSLGYTLYTEGNLNGLLAATYQKGSEVMHVYYVPGEGELNVCYDAQSELPAQEKIPTVGNIVTSVTQLSAKEINGMGYVFQLSDGSFIIEDGGYTTNVKQLLQLLTELNGGEEGIRIRLWVLSHSHDDHYPCFRDFIRRYPDAASIECIAYYPIATDDEQSGCGFFNSDQFDSLVEPLRASGTKVCTLHTGMTFTFSDLDVEVLMAADELYIDGPHNNFNCSSSVLRYRGENGQTLLLLADANYESAYRMEEFYGDYLKSDMCQAAHHGVEDFPLEVYDIIRPATVFYPCTQSLYDLTDRDADVRAALREAEYVKEILIRSGDQYTRYFE